MDELVRIQNLKKYYPIKSELFSKVRHYVKAVDGVSLSVYKGETVGLVGESGCGKTTLGKLILRLEDPTEGKIYFDGEDVSDSSRKRMKRLRRNMQIIFQDPYSSLNPRMKVGNIIGEPFIIHARDINRDQLRMKVLDLMSTVGLRPEHIDYYPHEFSGGQRQRIGIARALALHPKLVICDEPVASLDVSIQAQIINLLIDLQGEFDLTFLFISHNLELVYHISNRIVVMYLGRIVEEATNEALFRNPLHPYTRSLISATPTYNPKIEKKRITLKGEVPSSIEPPSGCHFHPRCTEALKRCEMETPELKEVEKDHRVRCLLIRSAFLGELP